MWSRRYAVHHHDPVSSGEGAPTLSTVCAAGGQRALKRDCSGGGAASASVGAPVSECQCQSAERGLPTQLGPRGRSKGGALVANLLRLVAVSRALYLL
jgi:hypothetical protein